MNAKIFIFIFALAFASNQIPYRGLMLVSTKPSFAKDILYIVQRIAQNAQFWTYSNIASHDDGINLKKHITNIEIEKVEFYPQEASSSFFYNPVEHKVTMTTNAPIINYQIHFLWSLTSVGINVAYGEGTAIISSDSFKVTLTLPEKAIKGDLAVGFKAEVTDIKGFGASNGLKEWIQTQLIATTAVEINAALKSNTHFLEKYIFTPYLYAERKVNKEHSISYVNRPTNSTELENKIWISFTTELKLDNNSAVPITKDFFIEDSTGVMDTGLFIAPGVATMTGEMYRQLGLYNMNHNLTALGYTGKIGDFFEAMPELSNRYDPRLEVKMSCKTTEISDQKGDVEITFSQVCGIRVETETEPFLQAAITHKIEILPTKMNDPQQLFIAKFNKVSIDYFDVFPRSPDIVIFMSRLFKLMGDIVFKGTLWHVPRLRYEPLREYYNFHVPQRTKYYVAIYETASQLNQ